MRRTIAVLATFLAAGAASAAGEPEFALALEGHKVKPARV